MTVRGGQRARILLVDDDKVVLQAMSRMVAEAGYDPTTADNWSEALRQFRDGKPDLVLLDVLMPTIDGFKLARIIKADATSFVPIILLTALEDLESKRRAVAAGFDVLLLEVGRSTLAAHIRFGRPHSSRSGSLS